MMTENGSKTVNGIKELFLRQEPVKEAGRPHLVGFSISWNWLFSGVTKAPSLVSVFGWDVFGRKIAETEACPSGEAPYYCGSPVEYGRLYSSDKESSVWTPLMPCGDFSSPLLDVFWALCRDGSDLDSACLELDAAFRRKLSIVRTAACQD